MRRLSGLNASAVMEFVWPARAATSRPVAASQSRGEQSG
jgi:hypothetical protein